MVRMIGRGILSILLTLPHHLQSKSFSLCPCVAKKSLAGHRPARRMKRNQGYRMPSSFSLASGATPFSQPRAA